jgi:ubiquitin carboxyl-terminal hydrolase 8|tara:strand:+ start:1185 stop:2216 length:1032 start_codon:yes stop_codon:yes gene_type:complete
MSDIKILSKYKNKGLSGLANLGNTCFINSCIQIISHTYELNEYLDSSKYSRVQDKKSLLSEWNSLRKILWADNCTISPSRFIRSIQIEAKRNDLELFTGFAQNDLPEFLLFLINNFHDSISRKVKMNIAGNVENETDQLALKCFEMIKNMYSKEYSEVWNLFYGIHVSQIKNTNGTPLSETPEPFFMINLPIPPNNKNPSLIDCFEHYTTGETLSGENAWYNENTKKKQEVTKGICFWSLPNILTIDLKRFNNSNRKNQVLVSFPLDELDLSMYVIGYNNDGYVYELYGVCNHSGGVQGGHYTCYVKNANGKWYLYNDTMVTVVKNPAEIISNKAYCFFYRKK